MPVVLYGCETWLLKMKEELRWMVSENRVLRRVFVSKGDSGNKEVEKTT